MCFTPKISITTALIEFLVSGWLVAKFPQINLARFFSFFILLLGLYQFTEFMVCTTDNPELWGKLGFLIYTQIPAMSLLFTKSYTDQKFNAYLIMAPAVIFSLMTILEKDFIIEGTCSTFFVTIRNHFLYPNENFLNAFFYILYYYLYIALIIVCFYRGIINTKNKKQVLINLWIAVSVLSIIIIPLIFIIIFPYFSIQFPSIYCHFAMFFTLTAIITVNLERKIKKEVQ